MCVSFQQPRLFKVQNRFGSRRQSHTTPAVRILHLTRFIAQPLQGRNSHCFSNYCPFGISPLPDWNCRSRVRLVRTLYSRSVSLDMLLHNEQVRTDYFRGIWNHYHAGTPPLCGGYSHEFKNKWSRVSPQLRGRVLRGNYAPSQDSYRTHDWGSRAMDRSLDSRLYFCMFSLRTGRSLVRNSHGGRSVKRLMVKNNKLFMLVRLWQCQATTCPMWTIEYPTPKNLLWKVQYSFVLKVACRVRYTRWVRVSPSCETLSTCNNPFS